MKPLLDWKTGEIVAAFNEVSLWTAPFARLLLENIPMKPAYQVLDVGFGTGFPLLELSQRFDEQSLIYGMDIWEEAITYTQRKATLFDLQNIQFIQQSAESIPLENKSIDLVCSNLGINNFSNRIEVFREIRRILKPEGDLCITTNPNGTFQELKPVFQKVLEEMKLPTDGLTSYFQARGAKETVVQEFKNHGFSKVKSLEDQTNFRFVSGRALFDHSFIRIAFRASWEEMVPMNYVSDFFEKAIEEIDRIVKQQGEFTLSVPMLYFQFKKDLSWKIS